MSFAQLPHPIVYILYMVLIMVMIVVSPQHTIFLAYHTMPHSLAIHRPPLRIEHLGHFGIIHWDFIVFDLGFPMGNKESRIINQAPPNLPAAHLAVISRTSSVLPRLRCFCMKLYPDKPIRHVRITKFVAMCPI